MKLSETNVSLKSRKSVNVTLERYEKDRNAANFKLIIFNAGHFPHLQQKRGYDVINGA